VALFDLPRMTSVHLGAVPVCDFDTPVVWPDKLTCLGLANHSCGVPMWLANKIERVDKVRSDACASSCDRELGVMLRFNAGPPDEGWSAHEVESRYATGVPAEKRQEIAAGAVACLLERDANKLTLAEILAVGTQVSTCSECPWFANATQELVELGEQSKLGPASCQAAGMSPRTWTACDDPNPPTDCQGWCTLVANSFAEADLDESNSLTADEVGLYARSAGLKEDADNWATCIKAVTTCMVSGHMHEAQANLLGAAVFRLPPSTCEDCDR